MDEGKPGEMSENDREKKQKEDARKEREAGQAAHVKGEFDAAIKYFSKAMELDNEDVFLIGSRSAAYLEMGKYKECIADCIRVEEKVPNLIEYAEMRAMALSLKGIAYTGLATCSKQCDLAIEALEMACKLNETELRLQQLEDAKKTKEVFEKRERLGDRKREIGNKLYKENESDEAIGYYTQAIEFNPSDVKAYCNRALCYTLKNKLAEALEDTEKCLELDPSFTRGYLRKGNIEFEKKEYRKALETYEMGLKHDKENKELHDAISKCRKKMPPAASKDTVMLSHKALNEKQYKAMLDPEIQTILSDPIMRQVLIDFQQNSSDAHTHAKNKLVVQTLQKLLDADLL